MSVPAVFWRKMNKPGGVNASRPAPEKKVDPTPAESSTTKKPCLVFKAPKDSGSSTTFSSADPASSLTGGTPITSGTSWADSMEEDEAQFAAAFNNCQQCRELTETVSQQTKRIDNAESAVAKKEKLIVELEGEVQNKSGRVEELEGVAQMKDSRIVELETTVRDQELRIGELVAQVDEEGRRAQQLDDELQKKVALLQRLQKAATHTQDSNVQAADTASTDSDSQTEVGEPSEEERIPTPAPEDVPKPPTPEVADRSDQNTTAGATEAAPKTPVKSPASPLSEDEFPSLSPKDFPILGAPPPVPRNIFVTAENIKVVPPPPPPKKLVMAIDTSKFKQKPDTAARGPKVMHGPRRAKDGPAPVIDCTKDIRRMSKEEREPFGYGLTVQIVMGNETVASLPKYVFMQVSPKAYKHWTDNPDAPSMKLEAGTFTKAALAVHLEWITMHTYCNKVFSVTLKNENNDRFNFELIRCARALGLHSMYMGHFTRMYCQQIRDGPSEALVDLIEETVYAETDPIFDCMANNMALEYSKAKPQAIPTWNRKLAQCPKLAAKMAEIQSRKNFTRGKSPSPTEPAEEVVATAGATNTDPDAGWRATRPAYV